MWWKRATWKQEKSWDQVPFLSHASWVELRDPLISQDHIRLHLLHPPGYPDRLSESLRPAEDELVHCDVLQVALNDTSTVKIPYFAALSYEWGKSPSKKTVKCGNRTVAVTGNLPDAMRHIGKSSKPRLVWINFLCINQDDPTEKSAQVQRMSKI